MMNFHILYVLIPCLALHVLAVEDGKTSAEKTDMAEELYKKFFKHRRIEQLDAIKGFQKLKSYEKQYSMVIIIAKNIFTVVETSRAKLESSGFLPGVSPFPTDEIVRDALSNILENTALFAEITIRLPDISTRLLKQHNEWEVLFKWCLGFMSDTGNLIDKNTVTLIDLVNQELNYTIRHPNYFNPYRIVMKSEKFATPSVNSTKRKPKKLQKGPMLSRVDL